MEKVEEGSKGEQKTARHPGYSQAGPAAQADSCNPTFPRLLLVIQPLVALDHLDRPSNSPGREASR